MKKIILNRALSFLIKYNNYTAEEIEKLQYGLEGIYITITKSLFIFFLAFLLGYFKEVLLILILFNLIRYPAFGFHSKTSLECFIVSSLFFIVVPLLLINLNFSDIFLLTILALCVVDCLLFAPADTIKRPLCNKKKRTIRKISTFIIALIYSIIIFIFNDYYISKLLLCSLVILSIVINPITYIIFRQPYNNYKKTSN